jgi:hypothetical protein
VLPLRSAIARLFKLSLVVTASGLAERVAGRAFVAPWKFPRARARVLKSRQGFNAWKDEHSGSTRDFPTPSYVLLHTLAHLLLTEISLECGYPASSIRERIYVLPKTGYGILLYTGSSDAEGTLGGLVQVGHRLDRALVMPHFLPA